jgi:hypothetical protein
MFQNLACYFGELLFSTHTYTLTHSLTRSQYYRSLSGLGRYVSTLEAKRRRRTDEEQRGGDPAEIDNYGKSVEAESKTNGLLGENDKDCDIVVQPAPKMVQSDDSASRDRVEVNNSTMGKLSISRDNSNSLPVEDTATVSMEVDENKNGEKNSEQDHTDGGRAREEEELNRSETSSRRPRRTASSTAKPKAAASQVGREV